MPQVQIPDKSSAHCDSFTISALNFTDLTQWLRLHARYMHSLGLNPGQVTNLTDYFLLPGVTLFYHQLDWAFQNVIQGSSITSCYE